MPVASVNNALVGIVGRVGGVFGDIRNTKDPMAPLSCPVGQYYARLIKVQIGEQSKNNLKLPFITFRYVIICTAVKIEDKNDGQVYEPGDTTFAGQQPSNFRTIADDPVAKKSAADRMQEVLWDITKLGLDASRIILTEERRDNAGEVLFTQVVDFFNNPAQRADGSQPLVMLAINSSASNPLSRFTNLRGLASKADVDALLGYDCDAIPGVQVQDDEPVDQVPEPTADGAGTVPPENADVAAGGEETYPSFERDRFQLSDGTFCTADSVPYEEGQLFLMDDGAYVYVDGSPWVEEPEPDYVQVPEPAPAPAPILAPRAAPATVAPKKAVAPKPGPAPAANPSAVKKVAAKAPPAPAKKVPAKKAAVKKV